jgi:outer membrane protein assembly factor BamB
VRFSVLAMIVVLISTPALAQNQPPQLTPEQKADTEALRTLVNAAPLLPVEQVEIKINPPMTLEGYSAVAGDKQGNVYILHRPESKDVDPVVVIDSKGKFLRSWGKGTMSIPHSIRLDPADNVWVGDAHTSMFYKFTPEGKKLMEISVGDIPDPNRPFCGATDTAFASNGHIFISDGYCNGRFIEYGADGKKLREWGKRGTSAGEFNVAHDIAITNQRLYVADRENGRLQWFDLDGRYLGEKKFGGRLYSVAVSPAGDVYVGAYPRGVPAGTDAHILKFDPTSGKILGKIQATAHQLSIGPDGTLLSRNARR